MGFFSTWRGRMARTPVRRPQAAGRRLTFDILEDRTLLSVYVVDRLTDLGEGKGLTGDLRYCLTQAADGDEVQFGVTGTINLRRALPDLTHSVRIEGPGADLLTVRRNSVDYFRIFTMTTAEVTISGLTVANGEPISGGGAISVNGGTLTLADDVLTGNSVESFGGAVFVLSGSIVVTNSTITNNRALSGGGLYLASGGMRITNSTITNNRVIGYGEGGGLYIRGGVVSIDHSTLVGNAALGIDGECYYNGCEDGTDGRGGGIDLAGGLLTIDSSTLSSNEAIGGNETCRYDASGDLECGRSGNGQGGGLYVGGGTLVIDHTTITANSARGGSGLYFGDGRGNGGGVAFAIPGQTHDTILAGNSASTSDPDISGNLGSLGHSLIGDTQGGSGFDATDLLNVNPRLGPLADNGGPTLTHALLPGSPAIDAGDDTDAPDWDQRGEGFYRIIGDHIDIGAFEVQADSAPHRLDGSRSLFPSPALAFTPMKSPGLCPLPVAIGQQPAADVPGAVRPNGTKWVAPREATPMSRPGARLPRQAVRTGWDDPVADPPGWADLLDVK